MNHVLDEMRFTLAPLGEYDGSIFAGGCDAALWYHYCTKFSCVFLTRHSRSHRPLLQQFQLTIIAVRLEHFRLAVTCDVPSVL